MGGVSPATPGPLHSALAAAAHAQWQSLARQTNGSTCAGITPAATCRAEVPAVALAGKISLEQINKEVDQVFNLFDVDGM